MTQALLVLALTKETMKPTQKAYSIKHRSFCMLKHLAGKILIHTVMSYTEETDCQKIRIQTTIPIRQ
jgi:hypothetical protein